MIYPVVFICYSANNITFIFCGWPHFTISDLKHVRKIITSYGLSFYMYKIDTCIPYTTLYKYDSLQQSILKEKKLMAFLFIYLSNVSLSSFFMFTNYDEQYTDDIINWNRHLHETHALIVINWSRKIIYEIKAC